MDKTIEKEFLRALNLGITNCILAMMQKYDLDYTPKRTTKEEQKRLINLTPEEREKQIMIKKKWQQFYEVELPDAIKTEAEKFDDTVITITYDASYTTFLIEEIECNLTKCQTDKEKEHYLFSLLKPFKRFSDTYYPKALIEGIDRDIKEAEKDKIYWQSKLENKTLTNTVCKPSENSKEQIEACDKLINRYRKEIDRCKYISEQFTNLMCNDDNAECVKVGTVESYLRAFVHVEKMFANELDALLLEYGIDLMRLQEECGIYLKSHRYITDVFLYIGSLELAQKYINELPAQNNNETNGELQQSQLKLPEGLDTQRAQKYFSKAIKERIIVTTDAGYNKMGISKAQLAYFLEFVFCRDDEGKDNHKDFPETALNTLFKESRLGKARGQYLNNKTTRGKPKGFEVIDNIFG